MNKQGVSEWFLNKSQVGNYNRFIGCINQFNLFFYDLFVLIFLIILFADLDAFTVKRQKAYFLQQNNVSIFAALIIIY